MAVKYSLFNRKAIIVFSLIVFLIIGAILGIDMLKEAVTDSSSGSDEVLFPNMFSGSRYFFRIGYPDDWYYETGLYGFFLNGETKEVVELYPRKPVNKMTNGEETDTADYERVEGVSIKIYYTEIENDSLEYTAEEAMTQLLSEMKDKEGYVFGKTYSAPTENVNLRCTEYTLQSGEEEYSGKIYTAVRTMCKYVIVTECKKSLVNEYGKTIDKMTEDFRFSVFDH